MAKIENFYGDIPYINLTASVGENGINSKTDVMVVQAMLKYAFEERPYFFKRVKFPEPTGTMCGQTAQLIRQYQRYLRIKNKISISVDGRIDEAKGECAFGKKGQWTILSLNADASETWFLSGAKNNNYMEDLCRRFPQLFAALPDVPVGTLNLPLEYSNGVGSLGLELA